MHRSITFAAGAWALAALLAQPAAAEWTNRYPKIAGVAHHVYLEGFNLVLSG